jgi:hypothetical protein
LLALEKKEVQKEISITFEEPVHESELISEMSKYQVGVIPYDYKYPYNHCSPNKLGQYIAAGLPVISNDQAFIADIVSEFKLGLVFNWNIPSSFKDAVEFLSVPINLSNFEFQTFKAFSDSLNWEHFAVPHLGDLLVPSFENTEIENSSAFNKLSVIDNNPLEMILLRELADFREEEIIIPIGNPLEEISNNKKSNYRSSRKKILASLIKSIIEFALTFQLIRWASLKFQSMPIIGTKLRKFKESSLRFW